MKRTRSHQNGYIFRKGNGWYLRYRIAERQADNSVKQVQKCKQLAIFGGAYRSVSSVRVLADEFLAPFNDGKYSADSSMSLTDFIEHRYLPYVQEQREKSTYAGYKNLWGRYIQPRGDAALRDWRTCECEAMLFDIAEEYGVGKETMKRIKSFLSGAFRYAIRLGLLPSENPMRETVLPKCREGEETYAYSLDEILRIIELVPEPASTMIAVGGFAALRLGEIRGLDVEHYDHETIFVKQAAWRSHLKRVKTKASKAHVPVIAQLGARIDAHIKRMGSPSSGLLFPNGSGKPLDVQRMVAEVIRPALEGSGIEWHGWHALRRGLASNLYELGVQDKVIQAILRHSDLATTQRCYIKTTDPQAFKGMKKLERKITCATSVQLAKAQRETAPDVSLPRVM